MNHDYITEFNLVDQYLLGKLGAKEVEEFERHFVDCAQCVEQLNISRNFIADLKSFAAQETLLSINHHSPLPAQWSVGQPRRLRIAAMFAACAILISGIFVFLGVRRLIHLEAEVRQVRQDASAIAERYHRELEAAAESQRRDEEDKQKLSQQIRELAQAMQPRNTHIIRVPDSTKGSEAPEVNFPIFALPSVSRGQGAAPSDIALAKSTPSFAISVPIEDRRDFASYRIKIVNSNGRTVWQRGGFRPDAYHSLSMSLKSTFLSPGSYELSVEGLTLPSHWTAVGSFPFRLTKHR